MKFKTKKLKDIIKAAAALAPKKSTFADLEGIKLHFAENALTVTGSDLDNAYEGTVYAINSEECINEEVLISAAAAKYISSLKTDIMEITVKSYNPDIITINGCDFPRLSLENYPEYNFEDDYKIMFGIHKDDIKHFTKTVKAMNAFTAKNESRPILCGMNFMYDDGNIYIAAVDGYHAARYKVPTIGKVHECNFTLNSKFADVVSHLNGAIHVYEGKNHIRIKSDNGTYIIRKLDGEFFDIRKSFPNRFISTLEIDVADLTDKIKNITSIATAKERCPIIFDFEEDVLSYKNSTGRMSANINGIYDGIKFRIGFNYKFFLDMIKLYSGIVTIKFAGELIPIIIDNNGIQSIVLPVRLRTE